MAEHDGPGGCVPWEKHAEVLTRMHRLEAAVSGHREMTRHYEGPPNADDLYLYAILDERNAASSPTDSTEVPYVG